MPLSPKRKQLVEAALYATAGSTWVWVLAWVEGVLKAQNYGGLSKRERGVVRAYVEKVTGISTSQTTRAFLDHGVVRAAPYQRHRFGARYTAEDIALLAEVARKSRPSPRSES